DVDDSAGSLTYNVISGPSHGTAAPCGSDGSCTYTPTGNFSGSDSFTYQVQDPHGANSNIATVSINVTPVNDPPVASDGATSTSEANDDDFQLNISDPDNSTSSLTIVVATTPAHGDVNCSAGGGCTYSPDANFHGSDSFTFRAKDPLGAMSNLATESITVTSVNDPPVATGQAVSTLENTAKQITLTATDVDRDSLT